MPRLENWKIQTNQDGYKAPERVKIWLVGYVFDHFQHVDNTFIQTTRIIDINFVLRRAQTRTGTIYDLGVPDPEWIEWLKLQDKEIVEKHKILWRNNQ